MEIPEIKALVPIDLINKCYRFSIFMLHYSTNFSHQKEAKTVSTKDFKALLTSKEL